MLIRDFEAFRRCMLAAWFIAFGTHTAAGQDSISSRAARAACVAELTAKLSQQNDSGIEVDPLAVSGPEADIARCKRNFRKTGVYDKYCPCPL